MSSIVERLTEGIVNRDVRAEGNALLSKWEKTGLLEGIDKDTKRHNMARLLENQAKELLRETSTMAGSDVEGFAAVAFPIVRRVFASLIANDLVSVQPMSLPSGLIFFLDFTTSTNGAGLPRLGYGYGGPRAVSEKSLFGGDRVGAEITGGIRITGSFAELGPYNMNNGYASPTGSATLTWTGLLSGTFGAGGELDKVVQFDPEFTSGTTNVAVLQADISGLDQFNTENLTALVLSGGVGLTRGANLDDVQCRRLTRYSGSSTTQAIFVLASYGGGRSAVNLSESLAATTTVKFPQTDDFATGGSVGSVIGQTSWGP